LRAEKGLRIAVAIGLGALFSFGFASFVPAHAIHGDEVYYISRSMQNLGFLEGSFPYGQVTFSLPNHPFTGELLMGLGLLLSGQTFAPSSSVWMGMPKSVRLSPDIPLDQTFLTSGELDNARYVSLLTAAFAVAAIVYLVSKLNWLAGLLGFLFAVSAPGFIDISVTAMLDVYCAVFTVLSIIVLYWYIKGSWRSILASGVFLGLALGSKLSWDPIIAGVVILTCVLMREDANRTRVVRLGQNWIAAVISFAVTSPVVVLRFPSEIRDSFGSSLGRFATTNSTSGQSLFSTNGIAGFIQPPILIVYALLTASAMLLLLRLWRDKNPSIARASDLMRSFTGFLKENPEAFFLFIVVAFTSLDMLLSPLEFEYGRNFQRLGLYTALASAVSLAYLVRSLKWRRVILAVTASSFALVIVVDWLVLGTLSSRLGDGTFSYASFGVTVVMSPLALGAGVLIFLTGAFIALVFLGTLGTSVGEVLSPRR
jgi:4-amino-4-deoxy-L-arabinose transferase-like glycosyltransferase